MVAMTQDARREAEVFDALVAEHGDFNPFSRPGLEDTQGRFRAAGAAARRRCACSTWAAARASRRSCTASARGPTSGCDLSFASLVIARRSGVRRTGPTADATRLPFADELVRRGLLLERPPPPAGQLSGCPARGGAGAAPRAVRVRLRPQRPPSGDGAVPPPQEPVLRLARGEPRRAPASAGRSAPQTSAPPGSQPSASGAWPTSPTAPWRPVLRIGCCRLTTRRPAAARPRASGAGSAPSS